MPLPDGTHVTFLTQAVTATADDSDHTHAWAFSHNGEWFPPQLRNGGKHQNWYKLTLITSAPGNKRSPTDLQILDAFVADYIPTLNQALFPP